MAEGQDTGISEANSICPSKSTVYLANISYSITNNDLIKIVEHCGKVVCAKIVKDKLTRKSKGYAFVQFLQPEAAAQCVQEYQGSQMFGRRWTCSIATDNGRSAEFIRKRVYPDKSRCYECGEFGHLSYKCAKNALGDREPPPKKKRKRQNKSELVQLSGASGTGDVDDYSTEDSNNDGEAEDVDSLHAAINNQRQLVEEQEYREAVASGNYSHLQAATKATSQKHKFVKDGYFSDEEMLMGAENDED